MHGEDDALELKRACEGLVASLSGLRTLVEKGERIPEKAAQEARQAVRKVDDLIAGMVVSPVSNGNTDTGIKCPHCGDPIKVSLSLP